MIRGSGNRLALAAGMMALALAGSAMAQSGPGDRPARNLHRGESLDRDGRTERDRNRSTGTVMGSEAGALIRLFGEPRLDIHEGAGHKLQFANERCILDAYLYAPRDGAQAVVTHVDARAPDGSDVDPQACAALLRRH